MRGNRAYLDQVFNDVSEQLNVEHYIFDSETSIGGLDSDGVGCDEDEP